jgi:hypothetical protein
MKREEPDQSNARRNPLKKDHHEVNMHAKTKDYSEDLCSE